MGVGRGGGIANQTLLLTKKIIRYRKEIAAPAEKSAWLAMTLLEVSTYFNIVLMFVSGFMR